MFNFKGTPKQEPVTEGLTETENKDAQYQQEEANTSKDNRDILPAEPQDLTPIVDLLKTIQVDIDAMRKTQLKTDVRLNALEHGTPEAIHAAEVKVEEAKLNHTAPQEYIDIVTEVCGPGFEVHTTAIPGRENFRLTIIPPKHLRAVADNPVTGKPEDLRVKTVSKVEGQAGVRAYAEQVAAHCANWSRKNRVTYDRN